ncbi:MAG: class I SAM-dependent methyltransferase [Candidatus Thorarchaeota archaeon]
MIESYRHRYGTAFWTALREMIGSSPRMCVVDLGCGPGLFLVDAARLLGATTLYGLDASREMLSQAQEFLEALSPAVSFKLICHDLDEGDPPLPTESADLVFSGFLLHELERPESVLMSARRFLKPSGVCAAMDYVSGDEAAFVDAMTRSGMAEEQARKRYPHMCKRSVDDIMRIFEEAGLRRISARRLGNYRAIVIGVKVFK